MTDAQDFIKRRNTLQTSLNALRNQAAVAEAEEKRLKSDLTEAMKTLKDDFGCKTYQEAITKLQEIKKELETDLAKLEELVSALGK